jgi:hypothetical protein
MAARERKTKDAPTGTVRRGGTGPQGDHDHERFGVEPGVVAPWEDGRRAPLVPGSFEWWYFDALLEDRTSVIVVFYTKHILDTASAQRPMVSISIRTPDGTLRHEELESPTGSFAEDRCHVRIGASSVLGDLTSYVVTASTCTLTVKMRLRRSAPPLRIGTGHLLFADEQGESSFGWIAPVPAGGAEVDFLIRGQPLVRGRGLVYHDHNWGDAPLASMMLDWYWARCLIGANSADGTAIGSYIRARPAYGGGSHADLVVIDRENTLRVQGHEGVVPALADERTDAQTRRPLAHLLAYRQGDIALEYQSADRVHVQPSGRAAYHRFVGPCRLAVDQAVLPGVAISEYMWLGEPGPTDPALLYIPCGQTPVAA